MEWWLVLLAAPLALLVLAGNLLMGVILLRESRGQMRPAWRAMSARTRVVFAAYLVLGTAAGGAMIWVFETPASWRTTGWVLLGVMGAAAIWALVVGPVVIWREYRADRAARRQR